MPKKRKHYKKRSDKGAPKHSLPTGFWSQIGALFLIAISILFVVAWFGSGGPVLNWIHSTSLYVIGYAVYTIPFLFVYIAVEIFRAENNRLTFAVKFATATAILWFSALFGLLKDRLGNTTGGIIGDLINSGTLALVNPTIAAFIYILLLIVTLLFIMRVSPFSIIKKLWQLSRRDTNEEEENIKIMRNAAAMIVQKPH